MGLGLKSGEASREEPMPYLLPLLAGAALAMPVPRQVGFRGKVRVPTPLGPPWARWARRRGC